MSLDDSRLTVSIPSASHTNPSSPLTPRTPRTPRTPTARNVSFTSAFTSASTSASVAESTSSPTSSSASASSSATKITYAAPLVRGKYISMNVISVDTSQARKKHSISRLFHQHREFEDSSTMSAMQDQHQNQHQDPILLLRQFFDSSLKRAAFSSKWNLCFWDENEEQLFRTAKADKLRKLFLTFMRLITLVAFFLAVYNFYIGYFISATMAFVPIIFLPLTTYLLRTPESAARYYRICVNFIFVVSLLIVLISRVSALDRTPSYLLIFALVIFIIILKSMFVDALVITLVTIVALVIGSSTYMNGANLWRVISPIFLASASLLFLAFILEKSDRRIFSVNRKVEECSEQHRQDRQRTVHLLNSIYPSPVTKLLLQRRCTRFPTYHSSIAVVLVADICHFTEITSKMKSEQVVNFISRIFSSFDIICQKYGIEKVKSIGTCYVAVGSLFVHHPEDAFNMCCVAQEMLREAHVLNSEFETDEKITVRIGIHQGSCHGFVVSCLRNTFDIYGQAPSYAWKLMRIANPQEILVSSRFSFSCKDKYEFRERMSSSRLRQGVFSMLPSERLTSSPQKQSVVTFRLQDALTVIEDDDLLGPGSRFTFFKILKYLFAIRRFKYKWIYKGLSFDNAQEEENFWRFFYNRERFYLSMHYSTLVILSCFIWGIFELDYCQDCQDSSPGLCLTLLLRYWVLLPAMLAAFTAGFLHNSDMRDPASFTRYGYHYSTAALVCYSIFLVFKIARLIQFRDDTCLDYTKSAYSINELLLTTVLTFSSPVLTLRGTKYISIPIISFLLITIIAFGDMVRIYDYAARVLFVIPFVLLCYIGMLKSGYSKEKLMRQEYFSQKEQSQALEHIESEHVYAKQILLATIPEHMFQALQTDSMATWQECPEAVVLTVDICDFQRIASLANTSELLGFLTYYFQILDSLCEQYGVEPRKIAGDTYFAVGTLETGGPQFIEKTCRLAFRIREMMIRYRFPISEDPISIRIGLSLGPIIGGLIGRYKISYDIWGSTVRSAWNMQRTADPLEIQISNDLWRVLKRNREFDVETVEGHSTYGVLYTKLYLREVTDPWSLFARQVDWLNDYDETGRPLSSTFTPSANGLDGSSDLGTTA